MLQIPYDVDTRFEAAISEAAVAEHLRPHFRRWLRFYLDFCAKYDFKPTVGTSFRPFNAKRWRRWSQACKIRCKITILDALL